MLAGPCPSMEQFYLPASFFYLCLIGCRPSLSGDATLRFGVLAEA